MGLFSWFFGKKEKQNNIASQNKKDEVLESGNESFPTAKSLIRYYLDLWDENSSQFISYHLTSNEEAFIQIIYGEDINLNITYKEEKEPLEFLTEKGVQLPEKYEVSEWEKGTYVLITGPGISKESLAELTDEMFKKLYTASENYQIKGWLE